MKQKKVKIPKGVSQEFLDSIQSISTEELKSIIVTLQVQNDENEQFKLSPDFEYAKIEFDQAKDRFELVAGPVKDTTVSIKNRTKAVIERLKEKGSI